MEAATALPEGSAEAEALERENSSSVEGQAEAAEDTGWDACSRLEGVR